MISFLCALVDQSSSSGTSPIIRSFARNPLFEHEVIPIINEFRCVCRFADEDQHKCVCDTALADLKMKMGHNPPELVRLFTEKALDPSIWVDTAVISHDRIACLAWKQEPLPLQFEDGKWFVQDLGSGVRRNPNGFFAESTLPQRGIVRLYRNAGLRKRKRGQNEDAIDMQPLKRFKCDVDCYVCTNPEWEPEYVRVQKNPPGWEEDYYHFTHVGDHSPDPPPPPDPPTPS